MSFPVSKNVAAMKGSSTLKAAQKAAELRGRGIDVIDLSVGEPDFDTPKFIKNNAIAGLEEGFTKYTPTAGLPDFRSAIINFYRDQFGSELSTPEVAASCGGKQALFNAACALLNPGDEVLIPTPYWVTFPEIVTFCGAVPVDIDTEPTDFVLTAAQVADAITDRTKLLIINSPNNPTGRVISPEEMQEIVRVCQERDVYVLTDECYLFFVYPPATPFSLASLPAEQRWNVCVAGTFSKTYAMTGWRIGYTIAPPEWTAAMMKLQGHSATHPTSFVQYACARSLEQRDLTLDAIKTMTDEYRRRRDWFIPALNEIRGFSCPMPEGAFYGFVDVRDLLGGELRSSADVANELLTKAHIVVTDGEGFGGDGFLRFSYAASMDVLERAIAEMKRLFG